MTKKPQIKTAADLRAALICGFFVINGRAVPAAGRVGAVAARHGGLGGLFTSFVSVHSVPSL
jgi:hypothetical protein